MTREEFVTKVRKLASLIDNEQVICEELEIHPATLRRWLSGAACPLPRARVVYISDMTGLLEEA